MNLSIMYTLAILILQLLYTVSASVPIAYVTPVGCDENDPNCVTPANKTLLNLLYVYTLQLQDGKLDLIQEVDLKAAPLWVTIHPNNKWLYTVSADNDAAKNGWIHSFLIDSTTGMLTLINRVSSQGIAPVHLNFDATGRYMFTVNYVTGSVLSFRLNTNGSVGIATDFLQHYGHSVDPDRQTSPHPHSVNAYPVMKSQKLANQFLYVPDLGLDRVYQYVFNPETGKLNNNSQPFITTPSGAGPRHMAFNAITDAEARVYLLSEMASTITVLKLYKNTGLLSPTQTISTLPANFSGFNKAAELYLYPEEPSYLYASNRGPTTNSIIQYKVSAKSGHLIHSESFSTGVSFPRHFRIVKNDKSDKDLMLIEGQDSHNILPFYIDRTTGSLTRTQADPTIVSTPACIAIRY